MSSVSFFFWVIMQPFPLQTSPLIGGAVPPSNPMTFGPVGIGTAPRNVNIHIHAGMGDSLLICSSSLFVSINVVYHQVAHLHQLFQQLVPEEVMERGCRENVAMELVLVIQVHHGCFL